MQPYCAWFTLSEVTSTVVSAWYGTDSTNTLKIRWQWSWVTHWVTLLHDGLLRKERWEGINSRWDCLLIWPVSCITHSLSQIHALYARAIPHMCCSSPTYVSPIPRFPIWMEGQSIPWPVPWNPKDCLAAGIHRAVSSFVIPHEHICTE